MEVADEIVVLRDGAVQQSGSPARPRTISGMCGRREAFRSDRCLTVNHVEV